MKTVHLKKRFYTFGKSLSPSFFEDTSTKGDREYTYVNQITATMKRFRDGQWEMLELQFNQAQDGIYLNAGLSPDEYHKRHPAHSFKDPEEYRTGTSFYFRAARLWTKENLNDCWFVKPKALDVDSLYCEAGTTDYAAVMEYLYKKYPFDSVDALDAHLEWQQRLMYPQHCFFKSDGEAMDDIEKRIVNDVLPYFDRMAARARRVPGIPAILT